MFNAAQQLLNTFMDLQGLTPDYSQWTVEALEDNPPRLIRLKQLHALFLAFEIPWDIQNFINGEFLDKKTFSQIDIESYNVEGLNMEMVNEYLEKGYFCDMVFSGMMKYRMSIEKVLEHNRGIFCTSGMTSFAYRFIEKTNNNIALQVPEIDRFLLEFINPEKKNFSLEELQKNYDYSTEDLNKIDIEWA